MVALLTRVLRDGGGRKGRSGGKMIASGCTSYVSATVSNAHPPSHTEVLAQGLKRPINYKSLEQQR